MEEKAARENFRVRQYSGGLPARQDCVAASYRELEPEFVISTSRCILHFDVDAFYAQVFVCSPLTSRAAMLLIWDLSKASKNNPTARLWLSAH